MKSSTGVVNRRGQRGSVNIGGTLLLGIAMVFLSLGFIFLPLTTDSSSSLLAYTYSPYPAITAATFTGYTAVVGITPMLIIVGFLTAGVIVGMMGIRVMKSGSGGSFKPAALVLLSLAIVFIGISLIIEPVALDGISANVAAKAEATDVEDVVTGVGVTTAHVTLLYAPGNNSTDEVVSVSSNATETPTVTSYNTTDSHLLISTLSANITHTLTTVYNHADLIDGTSDFTGYYSILLISPMLLHLGLLSGAVLSGFFGIRMMSREND